MGYPVATPVRGSAYKLSRRTKSRGLGFASWRDFPIVLVYVIVGCQIYGVSLMCPDATSSWLWPRLGAAAESWINMAMPRFQCAWRNPSRHTYDYGWSCYSGWYLVISVFGAILVGMLMISRVIPYHARSVVVLCRGLYVGSWSSVC